MLTVKHALKTSSLRRKDIAALFAGAGTGGTITGLSRAMRDAEKDGARRAQVVAIDPIGSILGGGEPGNYEVEGIGYVSILESHWSRWLTRRTSSLKY
jgi:cystathionine beta-synthase